MTTNAAPLAHNRVSDPVTVALSNTYAAISLLMECKAKIPFADLNRAVDLFRCALANQPPTAHLQPQPQSRTVSDLALALNIRFLFTGQLNDFHEHMALRAGLQAVNPTLSAPQEVSAHRKRQAAVQAHEALFRFFASISVSSVSDAMRSLRCALDLLPTVDPYARILPEAYSALGHALYILFRASGDISHLGPAIENVDAALDHIHKYGTQGVAAYSDLTTIEACRRALRFEQVVACGLPSETTFSGNPQNQWLFRDPDGFALGVRMDPDLGSLNQAISLLRQMLKRHGTGHIRFESLKLLASTLVSRFDITGDPNDIEEVITLRKMILHEGTSLPSFTRARLMYDVASTLLIRYSQNCSACDLDEAIVLYKKTLELLSETHPLRHLLLCSLANAIMLRFHCSGSPISLLDEAVAMNREAVDFCPSSDPDAHLLSLTSLVTVLFARFKASSRQEDIDEVIRIFQHIIGHLYNGNDSGRFAAINRFAMALFKRFKYFGNANDLEDAIFWQTQSVEYSVKKQLLSDLAQQLNRLDDMLSYRPLRPANAELDENLERVAGANSAEMTGSTNTVAANNPILDASVAVPSSVSLPAHNYPPYGISRETRGSKRYWSVVL
ncbi:hypothetical protein JR316_0003897 [Psilocybe cubensis]|uniref:Uncharacterized protein n=2 Tax=Psilocybe cubensis TaxID=181762 RepID=A0ACB8HB89_PSICU|nr:hypothetical protein JR316_0003897 [Psilocybe cubensis]KAH9484415.1 hypothetical protein JR316_0003897 [Psilocybe cubensis]